MELVVNSASPGGDFKPHHEQQPICLGVEICRTALPPDLPQPCAYVFSSLFGGVKRVETLYVEVVVSNQETRKMSRF